VAIVPAVNISAGCGVTVDKGTSMDYHFCAKKQVTAATAGT
jgi:hypothetical protein